MIYVSETIKVDRLSFDTSPSKIGAEMQKDFYKPDEHRGYLLSPATGLLSILELLLRPPHNAEALPARDP